MASTTTHIGFDCATSLAKDFDNEIEGRGHKKSFALRLALVLYIESGGEFTPEQINKAMQTSDQKKKGKGRK